METREDGTVFLRLPKALRRPIPFSCECPYCKAHPNDTPMWDTLAGNPNQPWTWIVHYPDLKQAYW